MTLIAASTMFACTMATVGVFLVQNFKYSLTAEQARLQSVGSIFGAVLSEPLSTGDRSIHRDSSWPLSA